MFIALPYNEALETTIFYVIQTEEEFIADEIHRFDSFQDWADFVIHETVYGAAKVVQYRDSSETEMIKELRKLWDENVEQQ
ncbi:MAG: hypothetical protein ACO24H_03490 [Polynucleobacter sp.]